MSISLTLSSPARALVAATITAAGLVSAASGATDNPSGACCYDDPDAGGLVCVVVGPNQCADLGGYFYGTGTVCSDPFVECEPLDVDAACCFEDPTLGWTCMMLEAYKCEDLGGTWFAGLDCSDPAVECDPTSDDRGACCYEEADLGLVCDLLTQPDCDALSGYWYGPTTVCTDPFVECDPLPGTGACCIEEGPGSGLWFCVEVSEADCLDSAGVWYGLGSHCTDPGVNCDPGPCDMVPGSECAGRPMYNDQDYLSFGGGRVAVQTVSPAITGDRMLTVFDLSGIGVQPFNTSLPIARFSHPTWNEANLGSILGLAMDEHGNIFVTASQTWNVDVAGPSGWGAVYRIDTNTAAISTFAVLPTASSSLGSITYDCDHGQFFVSSFEDGLIYRLDAGTGAILDTFDHGTPWSGAPGPVGLGDRPFGLEVNGERLYYAMWNEDANNVSTANNEIWSVPLDGLGAPVPGGEVLEITLTDAYVDSNWAFSSPISDIDFSPSGTMFLAERSQLGITNMGAHNARLLEYECTADGWVPSINVFNVGPPYSAAGGVDAKTERVWASGDALHIGVGDNIYGFMGIPSAGGSVADSWLIDYNGNLTIQDKTLLGDLVVTRGSDGPVPSADCPEIQVLNVSCNTAVPPYSWTLDIGVSNMDPASDITNVTFTPGGSEVFSTSSYALSLPPLHSWAVEPQVSGAAPGSTICFDVTVTFANGASCTEAVCATLGYCGWVPGDFDFDALVGVDDLMVLIGQWGDECQADDGACGLIDIDHDGTVGMGDLLMVLGNWSL